MTQDQLPSPPRRAWRTGLTIGLVVVTAGAIGVYAARRVLARDAVTAWLRAQGVESQIAFRAFDPGGFSGSLRVGPAADPDLTAEVAEIRYDLLGFWTGDRFGARVTSVRLVRPTLKARWHEGRLSLGSLDPLVEKLRKRPVDPNAPLPEIEVQGARLRLDTDYGRLQAEADARVTEGRLQRLDASLAPAVLALPDATAATGPAELHLVTHGGRVAVALAARLDDGRMRRPDGERTLSGGELRLSGDLPYPDLKRRLIDGEVVLTLESRAARAAAGGSTVQALRQTTSFRGRAAGWGQGLTLTGALSGQGEAAVARFGGTRIDAVSVTAQAPDFVWSRKDGDQARGRVRLTAAADRLNQGDITLTHLAADLTGPVAGDAKALTLNLAGRAGTHGAWTGLGAPKASDSEGDAALKRALAGFQLNAQAVALRSGPGGLVLDLPRPLALRTDTGGEGQLSRLGGPVYAGGTGGFRLTLAGGGLPQADLTVSRYRAADGVFQGQTRLDARTSLGPVIEGRVIASGAVRILHGGLTFTADRCADLAATRLELGANDVADLAGRFCPTTGPLLRLGGGGWRAHGATRDLKAAIPFLEAALSEAEGPLDLSSARGDLALAADLRAARLTDTAKDRRFNPLRVRGTAALSDRDWSGTFVLKDAAERPLAQARLVHDGRNGAGGVSLDTGDLAFAPGGLQPSALSPKAAMIGDPAQGSARFQGHVDWTPAGSTSGGTLEVAGLDFTSPAGAVAGLKGRVEFSSLVPLRAAPGQKLKADSVTALTALTGPEVTFGLDRDAVQVSAAGFGLSGGRVTAEPFEIPLTGGGWRAAVTLQNVELADLVEASPFADRMDLKARVSGRVPFAVTPQGLRIEGGELHAVAPGRISIRREALTGVQGEGGTPADPKAPVAPAAAADPYSDFVYQAMENLSFSVMTAEVASRPQGRLGVIFHIKGEHDPPQKAQIKLTTLEVLTRRITRKLPLPSGTKVDLTLDTSINLDQLLGDLADYERLHGSRPVQP